VEAGFLKRCSTKKLEHQSILIRAGLDAQTENQRHFNRQKHASPRPAVALAGRYMRRTDGSIELVRAAEGDMTECPVEISTRENTPPHGNPLRPDKKDAKGPA
jgi:hypothetical protein